MNLDIKGEKVLLVGNRGHKNMGDEIILVGNMKLLLKQGKKLYIACSDKKWLKSFHKQFFIEDLGGGNKISDNQSMFLHENNEGFYDRKTGEQIITYVYELPKGFRSFFRLLKNIKDLKKMFEIDSILIGGGEILTEETPYSYYYWFMSTWGLLPFKKLYLSGGIQVPQKMANKIIFNLLMYKSTKIYTRDFGLKSANLDRKIKKKIQFFPDTSIFLYEDIDLVNYKWKIKKQEKEKMVVVNINKKAEQFFNKIFHIVKTYEDKDYNVYFAYICKSPADDDIIYYNKLKETFPNIKLLDWENWENFINTLLKAEAVYCTRLHLFLISYYLNLNIVPFVYQKKVEKMKKVLFHNKKLID